VCAVKQRKWRKGAWATIAAVHAALKGEE